MPVLLVLLAVSAVFAQTPPIATNPEPLRVLFLGNSYTYYNDLPATVARLAEAVGGRPLATKGVTRGGSNLSEVWALTPALETLREGKWDVVVLQDFSTLGHRYVNGKWMVNEPTAHLRWVRFWHEEITRAGARTMLYLTWARKARPEFQDALNYAYAESARETGAVLAPAGLAWQKLRATAPQLELFVADGSHPSPLGTTLTACVFLETLTGQACTAIAEAPIKVNAEDWRLVGEAAHFAVEQVRMGALWNLPRPGYPGERALPEATAALPEGESRWRGKAQVYDGTFDMRIDLNVNGTKCSGRLHLEQAARGLALAYPLADCKLENNTLSFFTRDPRQWNEQYKFVLREGVLEGAHALRNADPYVRIYGSATLERDGRH
ncbi:MAG: hypothetical protein NW208_02795 [Bryobacter sp.]|nr:hypothetical protein [Bryobacter sp.]